MNPFDPRFGAPDASVASEVGLPVPSRTHGDGWEEEGGGAVGSRLWRPELARWLLSLNPGRTQDEYAKATRYFFETPGAPQDLDMISADLLLAYRGALALRAERRGRKGAGRARPASVMRMTRLERLWAGGGPRASIPGEAEAARDEPINEPAPLAPATVNLRLTALRQFLRFAAFREPLPLLSAEQIHTSLKRLPIERRRPYQILSEDEWAAFLAVARSPLNPPPAAPNAAAMPVERPDAAGAPIWGRTRADRRRAAAIPRAEGGEEASDPPATGAPARASDGRTGALTARRDYALVALALATGLRAIEISLLDIGDLTHERRRGRDEWWLTLPDEKTKGQRGGRALPLAADLMAALLDYIESTGRSFTSPDDRASPLFLALRRGPHGAREDAHGARLHPEQIRGVINRVETQWVASRQEDSIDGPIRSEARRISPHALRHSAAIALLKGSDETGRPPASVEHVRGWLGHFDIRTTQRYLDHLSSREERRRFVIAPLSASQPVEDTQPASHTSAGRRGDDLDG